MGLFSRKRDGGDAAITRLYYASDIHGSEVLWRKFLNAAQAYRADVLVMGGDLTGKVVIPFVERPDGIEVELFGERHVLTDPEQVAEMADRVRANGMYPYEMSASDVAEVAAMSVEEREHWFADVMRRTLANWLALADERLDAGQPCFVMPGNDDPEGVDIAIDEAQHVQGCDDRVVRFGDYTMISLGYSNPTPFDSPRELPEDELYARVAALADGLESCERTIFNLHVPPYDSGLDMAPALTEDLEVVMSGSAPKMIPVGSRAVRELIEHYQPLLSLHGHVHESPGATRIGRTLAINPGSDYHTGRINGCLVQLRGDNVTHQFVTG